MRLQTAGPGAYPTHCAEHLRSRSNSKTGPRYSMPRAERWPRPRSAPNLRRRRSELHLCPRERCPSNPRRRRLRRWAWTKGLPWKKWEDIAHRDSEDDEPKKKTVSKKKEVESKTKKSKRDESPEPPKKKAEKTYMLPVTSLQEKEVKQRIESSVAAAERSVRKRKVDHQPEAANVTGAMIVDLLSDNEDAPDTEQPIPEPEQELTAKQLEAQRKKEEKAAARKAEQERKKESQKERREMLKMNKTIVNLAGKAVVELQPLCVELQQTCASGDDNWPDLLKENLVQERDVLLDWKKAAAAALQKHAKNSEAKLEALPHVLARGRRWRRSSDTNRRPLVRRLHHEVRPASLVNVRFLVSELFMFCAFGMFFMIFIFLSSCMCFQVGRAVFDLLFNFEKALKPPSWSPLLVTMVDRTHYDPASVPELSLRQVFGRQRLSKDLCRLMADKKMLTVEGFAMLGDTIAAVKTTLKTIVADDALLGDTQAAVELALTSLAAVWKTCSSLQEHFAARRAKMEEDPSKVPEIPGDDHAEFREQFVTKHPDVLLPHHREPHRKFVERIQRDFLVHGAVPFYEVGEMRTRSEQIAQKSGLSKNAEDLLRVVTIDQPQAAASESQVMDKLHAFLVALEYLNICDFSYAAGPLRYLSELEEWRHGHRGLALLLTVDTLIRKKVYRLNADQRKSFPTFSGALVEVLTHHKQLWNDARSSAELEKFKQAELAEPLHGAAKRSKVPETWLPPADASTGVLERSELGVEATAEVRRWLLGQTSGLQCSQVILDRALTVLSNFKLASGCELEVLGGPLGALVGGYSDAEWLYDEVFRQHPVDALRDSFAFLGFKPRHEGDWSSTSVEEISLVYRRMCLRGHPSRGGSPKDYLKLQVAMELIKAFCGDAGPLEVEEPQHEGHWGDAEIKKAYRLIAMQCHPDKGGDKEDFQELTNAYEKIMEQRRGNDEKSFKEISPDSHGQVETIGDTPPPKKEHEGKKADSTGEERRVLCKKLWGWKAGGAAVDAPKVASCAVAHSIQVAHSAIVYTLTVVKAVRAVGYATLDVAAQCRAAAKRNPEAVSCAEHAVSAMSLGLEALNSALSCAEVTEITAAELQAPKGSRERFAGAKPVLLVAGFLVAGSATTKSMRQCQVADAFLVGPRPPVGRVFFLRF
eukprot:g10723.t1